MRLNNPPIIEAWIEFHLRGSENQVTWPDGLTRFLAGTGQEFSNTENLVQESFEVVQRDPSGMPREISMQGRLTRVRAFDSGRRRCVQVGQDVLIFNLIRGDQPYGGFRVLLPAAMEQFARYVEVFKPQSVHTVALHYVDLVRLPRSTDHLARLEDFFKIGVQVPDDVQWPIGRLSLEFTVPLTLGDRSVGDLVLGFRREPTEPTANEDRFRMDWHGTSAALAGLDEGLLIARITAIHEALKHRFRACFTDRLWSTFGEQQEEH